MKNMMSSRCRLGTDMLAFLFLCKNPAVFASKNPRILFMAKRQKLQECVSLLPLLTPIKLRKIIGIS